MPTVIDSLLVEIGLDISTFTDNQKKVLNALADLTKESEEQAKKFSEQGQKAAQFFEQMKKGAVEFLAVFTAGLGATEFTRFLTEADTGLGRLSERLGVSANTLGAWGNAATLLGGTAAGVDQTISSLITRFANIGVTGDTSLIPFFRALNIQIKTAADGTLDYQDALFQMADALSKMPRARATTFLHDMGISDPGTIALMLQGGDAVRKMVEAQKQLAPNPADIAAAEARNKAFSQFELTAIQVGRVLLTQLTPAINWVADALSKVGAWAAAHPDILGAIFSATAVVIVTAAVGAFVAALALVGPVVGGVTFIIAGLAAATTLVVENWQNFKTNIANIWNGITSIVEAAVRPILHVLNLLDAAMRKVTGNRAPAGSTGRGRVPESAGHGQASMTTGRTSAAAVTPTSTSSAVTGTRYAEQQADIGRLMSLGWTREQAEGIVANITRESGGKINATGDRGNAYGLGQWHPDRQAAFARWAGHDIRHSTRDEQLAFIDYELRNGSEQRAGQRLRGASSASSAAAIVSRLYERPANASGEAGIRASIADSLHGVGAGAATQIGTANVSTSIGVINVSTQATDAAGIARDIRGAITRQNAASDANGGFH